MFPVLGHRAHVPVTGQQPEARPVGFFSPVNRIMPAKLGEELVRRSIRVRRAIEKIDVISDRHGSPPAVWRWFTPSQPDAVVQRPTCSSDQAKLRGASWSAGMMPSLPAW